MIKKIGIVLGVVITLGLIIFVGFNLINKTDSNQYTSKDIIRVIKPESNDLDELDEDILKIIKATLEYVYNNGKKPDLEYLNNLDMQMEMLNNQRIYMDEFLNEIEELSKLFDDPNINKGIFEEEYFGEEEEFDGEMPDWWDEYDKGILENSDFILKDNANRDYIDVNRLDFFTDAIFFNYNGQEYMLDRSKYKMNMPAIRLMQKNFNYVWHKFNGNNLDILFIDIKTGQGKTVHLEILGNTITSIDFTID